MSNFNAEILSGTNGQVIGVSADTNWTCSVHGNFSLDKTYGEGNDTINIGIPYGIPYGQGTVLFSYDDEHCDHIEIPVYFNNKCYLETSPSYDKDGNIVFNFERTGQTFIVDFFTNGEEITLTESGDVDYFNSPNSIMVYPTSNDGGIISVNICDYKTINIVLCKKKDNTDYAIQA